jgi:hypothetical protein
MNFFEDLSTRRTSMLRRLISIGRKIILRTDGNEFPEGCKIPPPNFDLGAQNSRMDGPFVLYQMRMLWAFNELGKV